MLKVDNVCRIFGKGDAAFHALQDVSFTIPSGASVAITGKSGSGKSTLMHVMSSLDRPTRGSVSFDDKQITTLSQKEVDVFRAREMSFIFQAFFIEANRSCLDNVMLPLEIGKAARSSRVERAEKALAAVELSDKRDEKAKNLSGGQKQRLAIARAIVNEPKLLFADEPTGNLDSHTGDNIEDLLFTTSKKLGTTLVIVTHDQELAAKCDMQIRLKDGRIEEIVELKKKKAKRGKA